MAYRETQNTLAKKANTRLTLLKSARRLVQQGGFAAASAASVAKASNVAAGTIYRHFPNKSELVAEVFRYATEREVEAVANAAEQQTAPQQKLEAAITVFIERALKGHKLAYALIAEPVDPRVEQERLRYRYAYAEVFEDIIQQGIQESAFVAQDSQISAAAIVGLLAESLVGPLSPIQDIDTSIPEPTSQAIQSFDQAHFTHSLVALTLRAVGCYQTPHKHNE